MILAFFPYKQKFQAKTKKLRQSMLLQWMMYVMYANKTEQVYIWHFLIISQYHAPENKL